jgi:hypothetical protein
MTAPGICILISTWSFATCIAISPASRFQEIDRPVYSQDIPPIGAAVNESRGAIIAALRSCALPSNERGTLTPHSPVTDTGFTLATAGLFHSGT